MEKLDHSRKYDTSQSNPDNSPSQTIQDKQLTEIKNIEGTPFTAVRVDDKWFVALGKYRLTEPLPDFEACKEETRDTTWPRIMQIMKIVIIEHEAEKAKDFLTKSMDVTKQ